MGEEEVLQFRSEVGWGVAREEEDGGEKKSLYRLASSLPQDTHTPKNQSLHSVHQKERRRRRRRRRGRRRRRTRRKGREGGLA